jgi:hypothetical protein
MAVTLKPWHCPNCPGVLKGAIKGHKLTCEFRTKHPRVGAILMDKRGDKNGRWKGGPASKVCEQCRKEFEVKYVRREKARFCSLPCANLYQAENKTAKGATKPYRGGPTHRVAKVSVDCAVCGSTMQLQPSHVGVRKTCSHECSVKLRSKLSRAVGYSRCKHGKREDLGDQHFRSSWEANYARFLNLLISQKQIEKWEYEADTFWFEKIRRGVRSYTPDFKVWEPNGTIYYVELKGWMDAKSKTKLKRMAKYHPKIDLRLVDAKAYKEIDKKLGGAIPNWEKEKRAA